MSPAMRAAAWIVLGCAVLASGCKPVPTRTNGEVPFWKRILRDDFFFDSRSHDIERNLERDNNITIQ